MGPSFHIYTLTLTGSCYKSRPFSLLFTVHTSQRAGEKKKKKRRHFLHVETENWSWRCQHMEDSDWRSDLSAEFRRDAVNDMERQGILVSTCENMDWESPPSILVTRNLNWSLEIGYGDWLRKGKVLAPQLRPT
ncbi:hypothetical protein NC653_000501 [Populus alba x Populus x berolinensis]|uniref:Uncharacterized protein n=1 Tax=Populus alba x Populus x berolinensis TaxID=444605 RepID=A0AAD6WEF0_9ROSI|nr:hypothetical protein NC653_000501 [Populus alba x Populus x berolinensis]